MRASSVGLRTPGKASALPGKPAAQLAVSVTPARRGVWLLVLMVLSYVDIFEQRNRIVREHGSGAVERDEIGRESAFVDSLEANRQPGTLFSWKSWLEETNHALLLFPD